MHVKFESIRRGWNVSWKMPTEPAIEILWKFRNLFKVHQISSNWQNLLKSSSETCMWILSPFGEVKNFHEKMPTVPGIEIIWKFHTFSKFTKFHQTYRIYWNHHLKHACEIWVHYEKFKFFMKKMQTMPALEILWNFHIFSKFTKFHQTDRIYWNHHLKHACEIWVHSEKLKFYMKKWWQGRL